MCLPAESGVYRWRDAGIYGCAGLTVVCRAGSRSHPHHTSNSALPVADRRPCHLGYWLRAGSRRRSAVSSLEDSPPTRSAYTSYIVIQKKKKKIKLNHKLTTNCGRHSNQRPIASSRPQPLHHKATQHSSTANLASRSLHGAAT